MEFLDAVRRRHMTRAFTPEPVNPDLLESILEAALRAPTAGDAQGVELLVLRTDEERARFWSAAWPESRHDPDSSRFAAPVIVVPCANRSTYEQRYTESDKEPGAMDVWPVDFGVVDAAFATMTMLLHAANAGLGAWFFGLSADGVREEFDMPAEVTPIGAVAVGHPAEPARTSKRPRRPNRVRWGQWVDGNHIA